MGARRGWWTSCRTVDVNVVKSDHYVDAGSESCADRRQAPQGQILITGQDLADSTRAYTHHESQSLLWDLEFSQQLLDLPSNASAQALRLIGSLPFARCQGLISRG